MKALFFVGTGIIADIKDEAAFGRQQEINTALILQEV